MDICAICSSDSIESQRYDRHPIDKSWIGLRRWVADALKGGWRGSPLSGYIHICRDCGYGVLSTPPTARELGHYYRNIYWENRRRSSSAPTDGYKSDPRAIAQLAFVREHLVERDVREILEIGAGSASAALLLRDSLKHVEPQIYVCEPGSRWIRHYEQHGIVRVAELFPFETSAQFDYVHASHWLEHVRDLGQNVVALRDRLRPSGFLFVEVPNTGHGYWDAQISDEPHIHFFTLDSLRDLFEARGFSCVASGEFGITWQEWTEGVECTPDRFGKNERGFWIRALFQKSDSC